MKFLSSVSRRALRTILLCLDCNHSTLRTRMWIVLTLCSILRSYKKAGTPQRSYLHRLKRMWHTVTFSTDVNEVLYSACLCLRLSLSQVKGQGVQALVIEVFISLTELCSSVLRYHKTSQLLWHLKTPDYLIYIQLESSSWLRQVFKSKLYCMCFYKQNILLSKGKVGQTHE